MTGRSGLTLARTFALMLAGVVLLLGALFSFLLHAWQSSLMRSAVEFGESQSRRTADLVESSLYQAQKVLTDLETRIRLGACRFDDRDELEADLLAAILAHPDLSEITFTRGRPAGRRSDGAMLLAPGGRWQLSVFRPVEAEAGRVVARFVLPEKDAFVSRTRTVFSEGGVRRGPFAAQGAAPDPTEHPTFAIPATQRLYGEAQWTDLHYSQLDSHLPQASRRVAVSVMKTVEDGRGEFVGVARVGLLTRQMDRLLARENEENAPRGVFLCDDQGRLITRGAPDDRLAEEPDEALRVPEGSLPPELTLALHAPALARIRPGHLEEAAELEAAGARVLVTFKGLGRTQGWRVGVVVPESFYLAGLVAARGRVLAVSGGLLAAALLAGGLTLRSVRRGLGEIVAAAQRMAAFDFAPLAGRSSFRDVREVMASVELAKTALRAMSKYVPVDLVRHLYQTRREPVLGGEPAEVTLLFTDIEDFTRWSESLDPNELARLLGRYLETMTRAVHSAEGVIDKYIGDAVMAVWNAAAPCDAHESKACRAVVACQEAARALFGSPAWDGRPALVTRFGIHRDRVMVGHFGAPDRMSFTALGDGVNLASRLEALNKHYGTRVIASEAVYERASDAFAFRLLDRVAVKGKTRGVRVYELLGPAGAGAPAAHVRIYEQALAACWSRDFDGALALLSENAGDPPSVVLAERCRAYLRDPPVADWDGTFVSSHK